MAAQGKDESRPWVVHVGRDELIIRQRYEVASIANDLLIGIWFLIGSIFFLSESLTHTGTWLFILGSVQMLVRPTIRLTRRVHLHRMHPGVPGPADAAADF